MRLLESLVVVVGLSACGGDVIATGHPGAGSGSPTGGTTVTTTNGDAASTSSAMTGIYTGVVTSCSCSPNERQICTGTTTFTATPWTSGATALLAGCTTAPETSTVPTYTCASMVCGAPCGASTYCGSPLRQMQALPPARTGPPPEQAQAHSETKREGRVRCKSQVRLPVRWMPWPIHMMSIAHNQTAQPREVRRLLAARRWRGAR
jgi:hypothetical protein